MSTTLFKKPFRPAALLNVAATIGTPTYAYCPNIIRSQIAQFRDHLEDIPYRLLYAMKANSSPALLRIMKSESLGIDAVSPAELELAIRIGFRKDQILFSANNITDDEMSVAAESGVVMNIGESSRLERYGQAYPGSDVCIRFNPQIGAGHHEYVITAGVHSKFGMPIADAPAVRSIAHRHGLKIIGLHQHIGSGVLDTETAWRAMSVLLDTAMEFPQIDFINFGGGLGVPYRPDEKPFDLEKWDQLIAAPLAEYRDRHASDHLSFWFEPGRYLVAESGVLLVRVNTLKHTSDRTFAGVDSGMGHLIRPAIYNAYHAIFNLSNPDGPARTYDVVGNICESADFFARDRIVQEIREGDVLAILDTGAYGMSMSSVYNTRALPAEVMLDEGDGESITQIRKYETPSELIDRLYPELAGANRYVRTSER